MTTSIHATVHGPLVIIGLGSIGRGLLPLLVRHIDFDPQQAWVIDPNDQHRQLAEKYGFTFIHEGLTPENFSSILRGIFEPSHSGICINISVDASSIAIMNCVRDLGAMYIDTVTEPWPGFYSDTTADPASRTNEILRAQVLHQQRQNPGGPTAISCCGANPGMVSWLVKQALIDLALEAKLQPHDHGFNPWPPHSDDSASWSRLMKILDVRGIHVAERDTQRASVRKPPGVFWNTWSVDGLLSEGLQPAELGWGSHEKWVPPGALPGWNAVGSEAPGIFLSTPGAATGVRTWCPTFGPQIGFLITHNEALSLADFFTSREGGEFFRPTVHYAYQPCDDTLISLHEYFGGSTFPPNTRHVLDADEISDGFDELGVLLYGQPGGAYWYGSHLTIEEARDLAPHQNATGMQVTSAVLAATVWALENPERGIIETELMDHQRCLEVQRPYLGRLFGTRTTWTPLVGRPIHVSDDLDLSDPWQFRNILVH